MFKNFNFFKKSKIFSFYANFLALIRNRYIHDCNEDLGISLKRRIINGLEANKLPDISYKELIQYSGFEFTSDEDIEIIPTLDSKPPRYPSLHNCFLSVNNSFQLDCRKKEFWKEIVIPEFGVCGIFNANNEIFSKYNLSLTLNPTTLIAEIVSQVYYTPNLIRVNNYYNEIYPKDWSGTAFRIFDWDTSISWAQDYKICSGNHLCDIKLRQIEFKDTTASYGGCFPNITVLKEDCYSICYLREYTEKCCGINLQSLDSTLPFKHNNKDFTSNKCNIFQEELECSLSNAISRCTKECGQPCNTNYFENNFEIIPLWREGPNYQNSIKALIDSLGNFNSERPRFDVSIFKIGYDRYKRPYSETISVKQTFSGLISAIGGQLGLWGGMSVITVLEYLELVIIFLLKIVKVV